MRAFAGIELDPAVRDSIEMATRSLRSTDPNWTDARWVASKNLHITVRFLGDISEQVADAALAALRHATHGITAFQLPVLGLRAIPSRGRARMLWVELGDPEGRCADLAARFDAALVSLGIPAEQRPFRPHITLVRARRPAPFAAHALEEAGYVLAPLELVSVPSCTLFRSTLTRRGAVYEQLGAAVLGVD